LLNIANVFIANKQSYILLFCGFVKKLVFATTT